MLKCDELFPMFILSSAVYRADVAFYLLTTRIDLCARDGLFPFFYSAFVLAISIRNHQLLFVKSELDPFNSYRKVLCSHWDIP